MPRSAHATVKGLPAGARLEDLAAWLTTERLACAGLRRFRADLIGHSGLPGERVLLLTLRGSDAPDYTAAVAILIEAGTDGSQRWARITARAAGGDPRTDGRAGREFARSIQAALDDALRAESARERVGPEPP